ncbi:hypothetical protein Poli38472_003585 [Pythium oligandrum]|uniref:EF-hand domain-containing protein n=1 Tax=Pythium oligandrum TaxID=41045 RepID=A0A8K1FJ89_PYTOL|nr:hypothetical protein Poli38472_003585 [Pythium oligandrum]|eukprot:TMW65820.1 hypothetical protein Poli38472_003585 [Pythium oligandrum]
MARWRVEAAALLHAPWRREAKQQRYVMARVEIHEETTTTYALVFMIRLPDGASVERRVTKQHLTQLFAWMATLESSHDVFASVKSRVMNMGKQRVEPRAVDAVVTEWVTKRTTRQPTREELVIWLLSRMVVTTDSAKKLHVVICGEEGAENATADDVEDDDYPPPYSPHGPHHDVRDEEDEEDDPFVINEAGDHAAMPSPRQTAGEPSQAQSGEEEEEEEEPPSRSKYQFDPASTRRHSAYSTVSVNAWTEERRRLGVELKRSKKDLLVAKELQRKSEAIAALRRRQIIQQSQRKLLAHEQKQEDARVVKQRLADAVEYHTVLYRMEAQLKQTEIAAKRDQEKLTRTMRIAVGRSDKGRKGPVLGPGPLSQIEIDVWTGRDTEARSMWVYDLHGRRHNEAEAGEVEHEGLFVSAMRKIQQLLERKSQGGVDLFQSYDVDRSGTLDYREFQRLLLDHGVNFSKDQARVFFGHFDPNDSGGIDYGELLWGFFNRRGFLKRWKQRKTRLSPREVKQMFYKYDRVGRGALSLTDFRLAMDDVGFHLNESEAKLLLLRFDTNRDGFIDYNEFHAFVNEGEQREGDTAAIYTRVIGFYRSCER